MFRCCESAQLKSPPKATGMHFPYSEEPSPTCPPLKRKVFKGTSYGQLPPDIPWIRCDPIRDGCPFLAPLTATLVVILGASEQSEPSARRWFFKQKVLPLFAGGLAWRFAFLFFGGGRGGESEGLAKNQLLFAGGLVWLAGGQGLGHFSSGQSFNSRNHQSNHQFGRSGKGTVLGDPIPSSGFCNLIGRFLRSDPRKQIISSKGNTTL